MKIKNLEKSIILRKFYAEDVSLSEVYSVLGECPYIEDLRIETNNRKYIIGTIRKPYVYDAKRTIGTYDVTGMDECKFFKFLIKEEMEYFLIACHYEGSFGGFSIIRDYLAQKFKDSRFEIIYKVFENIKISDLKKIKLISSKYEKEQKYFGIFKKTSQEVREVNIECSDDEIATKDSVIKYLNLPDATNIDEENSILYLILKNNRKINILQPQNTHFKLDDLKYKDNLPEESDFVNKVYKIWETI